MISGASDEELDIAIARANVLLELQSKIDELKKENQELKKQLEQRDNIINKAKKIIDNFYISNNFVVYDNNDITKAIIELFKILNIDKGE